ncbi:SUMF1/EgtB/PvdO family nonheme iron enzyme [Dongia sp.]|uniref:SUMF1/EgtB/PvdO family nonheme iron enzyme n=1 Tax=Dongia sp. TaxID=1977262 RepID=UPI003753B028
MRLWGFLSLLLMCQLAWTGPAAAEPRVALVIGNSNYGAAFSSLPNPKNDAQLIAKALKGAGFEVNMVLDADQKQMKRAFADFGETLAAKGKDAVGLFYYAGHGVQVNGANYLIPTNADIAKEGDVEMEAVNADWVLQQMEFAENRMNIIILDACRNNPLPAGKRSAEKGLARMDAPKGSFLAYSTAPGDAALDGKGSNSPYSAALAKAIESDRVPLEQLFRNVRVNVMNATGENQVPWDASSLTGEFYFKRPDGSAPAQQSAALAPAPQPAAPSGGDAVDTSRTPEPAIAAGKVFRDCPDCPELVSIPAGSFSMGFGPGDQADRPEEKPTHKVAVKPFAIMTKEVTRDQFDAFVLAAARDTSGGCQQSDGGNGKWDEKGDYLHPGIEQQGNHPVVCVSGYDAADYAAWLSDKTGKHYRLPTEAEWEYAARAGKKTSYPWGNDISANACRFINAMDQSGHKKYPINEALKCDDKFTTTAPVGSFPANAFGVHDMLGNVWELVSDCWHNTYQGAPTDGSAWAEGCETPVEGKAEDGPFQPMRGGAWLENPWDSRLSTRWAATSNGRESTIGFRLVRDLD